MNEMIKNIEQEHTHIKSEAAKFGYSAKHSTQTGWSFKKKTRVWYCAKGYAVAELIDGYYKNHRYYKSIKLALEDANKP